MYARGGRGTATPSVWKAAASSVNSRSSCSARQRLALHDVVCATLRLGAGRQRCNPDIADACVERLFALHWRGVLGPAAAWERLELLREVLLEQPPLARAFSRLPLYDQVLLTLELLQEAEAETEVRPNNVLRFRPRR